MAKIGEGFNAGLGRVDYSPYIQGAWQQSNRFSQGFDRELKRFSKGMDDRQKKKGLVKDAIAKAEALAKLQPQLADPLASTIEQLKDEDTPISERAMMGEGVIDTIALGLGELQARAQRDVAREYVAIAQSGNARADDRWQIERPFLAESAERGNKAANLAYLEQLDQYNTRKGVEQGTPTMIAPILDQLGESMPDVLKGVDKAIQDQIDAGNTGAAAQISASALQMLPALLPERSAAKLETLPITLPDGRPGEGAFWVDPSTQSVAPVIDDRVQPGSSFGNDGNSTLPAGVPLQRPLMSNQETPQDAQTKARNDFFEKQLQDTLQGARKLSEDRFKLEESLRLLDDVGTGPFRETAMKFKRLLGFDVSSEEQLQVNMGDFVMDRVAQTKGAVSEMEMKLFQEYAANYGKSTEGNKRIIQAALAVADRAAEIDMIISDGMQRGLSPYAIDEAVRRFRESRPVLQALTPPQPETKSKRGKSQQSRNNNIGPGVLPPLQGEIPTEDAELFGLPR